MTAQTTCPDLWWLPNVSHGWHRVGPVIVGEGLGAMDMAGVAYACECGARWWEPRDSKGQPL